MTKKYRSKLEARIAQQLEKAGVPFEYEGKHNQLEYTSVYNPDFTLLLPNGIRIETKGHHKGFGAALSKLCKVKRDNPEVDLRILWENAKIKVPFTKNKRNMTAAEWSDKNGFQWAHQYIPNRWLQEK